jgi:hypothetical protein
MTVPTDLAAQAAAARQAAAQARRLGRELAHQGDRARISRFAADLEAKADALECAPAASSSTPQVNHTQTQQGSEAAHDKPDG